MFRRLSIGWRYLQRDLKHPRNIYASLRILFLLAHFYGLTPYHISVSPKTQRHSLHTSWFGYFNMATRCIFLHCNLMYSILHNHTVIDYFFITNVSHFTDSLQKFNGILGNLIAIAFCFFQRRQLCTLMQRMYRADERFYNVGVSFKQKFIAWRTNRFGFGLFALTICYFQLSMLGILARNKVYVSLPAAVSFYAPHLLVCGIVVVFNGFIYKLTQCYRALNAVEYCGWAMRT